MGKGFDIVVGNPPYIRQEKIDDMADGMEYKSMLAEIFAEEVKTEQNPDNKLGNTMDFSMYFIVRSRQLLRESGHHSFIITNKWLRASYGEPIRHFLKHEVQLTKFIDFVNCNIFRGASVDTVVFSFRKSDTIDGKISFCCPASLDSFAKSDHDYFCDQQLLDDKVWSFSDPLTEEIKQWIVSVGSPLKDMEVEINRGVTTGFNDAFIIGTETKNQLIDQDPNCAEIIKPLVKGKNIDRYKINWNGLWLIFTRRGIDIDQYPTIKEYLQQFREDLEPKPSDWKERGITRGRKPGIYKWYEIQDSTEYYKDFEIPKIMWQELSSMGSYSFASYPLYTIDTCYIMVDLPKWCLIQLNSKLSDFYFETITATMGKKGNRYKKQFVKRNRVILDTKSSEEFSFLVDYLHINQDSFEDVSNCLVYELYFHSKFHEDGLYPEDEMYLLNAIRPHLQPINYEEWSKLDWKRQLGEITDEESERLDELTEENNNIIEEVVNALENDEEVRKWMDVIKSHKWVKKIEGEDND